MVLATGRSWHGVRPLVDDLELPPGWSVASNGAVVVSYPPDRIVKAVTFDPREVIERVGRARPGGTDRGGGDRPRLPDHR